MQSGSIHAKQGISFPVLSDPDGNIRFVEVGYTTEAGLRLRLWLAG